MTTPVPSPTEPARSRRTVLAAAVGGVLAAVAGALGRPAPAAATHLQGFGHPNPAGTADTSLTTSSTGTALLVTQNGTGTALRGSAVGAGSIAGFFTAFSGTGISGVTGTNSTYGVYGGNDAATYGGGTGGAIRAAGLNNHGLVATTTNADANAVRGINTSTAGGIGEGVYGGGRVGVSGQGGVAGVYGRSETATGVYAQSTSGYAVSALSISGPGIWGDSGSGVGVIASSDSDDALRGYGSVAFKSGIFGANPSASGWAGYFEGNVEVTGTLSGPTLLSRIDHPLDPANQILAHALVGSSEAKNVYDGTVKLDARGQATVILPSWFDALNADVRYQLTAIGSAAPDLHIAAKLTSNRFGIAGGPAGLEVSWQVTGVRQDAHAKANPIEVESRKPADRRGRYLNPTAHGQAASKGWKDLPKPPELPERPIQPAP